jgi:hypothetical protein
LRIEHCVKGNVCLMYQDRSARRAVETSESADVVDMSMRADDGPHLQLMAAQDLQDALNLVPGIDYDCFPRDRIAEN